MKRIDSENYLAFEDAEFPNEALEVSHCQNGSVLFSIGRDSGTSIFIGKKEAEELAEFLRKGFVQE